MLIAPVTVDWCFIAEWFNEGKTFRWFVRLVFLEHFTVSRLMEKCPATALESKFFYCFWYCGQCGRDVSSRLRSFARINNTFAVIGFIKASPFSLSSRRRSSNEKRVHLANVHVITFTKLPQLLFNMLWRFPFRKSETISPNFRSDWVQTPRELDQFKQDFQFWGRNSGLEHTELSVKICTSLTRECHPRLWSD